MNGKMDMVTVMEYPWDIAYQIYKNHSAAKKSNTAPESATLMVTLGNKTAIITAEGGIFLDHSIKFAAKSRDCYNTSTKEGHRALLAWLYSEDDYIDLETVVLDLKTRL